MADERPITVNEIVPFLSERGQVEVRAAVAELRNRVLEEQLRQAQGVPIPELPEE